MSYDSGSNYRYPKENKSDKPRQVPPDEWALRDIDLVFDNADLTDSGKLKEIERILKKYFDSKKPKTL